MLRDFQTDIKSACYTAFQEGARNVMPVAPTGSGKTVIFCDILREYNRPGAVIAHRQELIGQAALALNREKVAHGIIAPRPVIRAIVAAQLALHGYSNYSARAPIRVAGVDSLPKHEKSEARWMSQCSLVVQDEGHHVLRDNKWGKAMALFPHAFGLFPTAHAIRADGAGLGRSADGLVDRLVVGPSCRHLINRGFLTDYRLICPPSDVDVSDVPVGPSGELNYAKLRAAVHKSKTIVGDVCKHYLRFAEGKLGVTFAVDIEAATEIATAYRKANIPAEVITAKTPLSVRAALMRRFRAREILQLVSVDVLGEGVDVPAIEVVSMARHTASFQLYAQQFGRGLRTMVDDAHAVNWHAYTDDQRLAVIRSSLKPNAIILDHVSNWQRHGLPDKPRGYTLDKREKKSRNGMEDAIPLRICLDCLQPYERILLRCPYCGVIPEPGRRGSPDQVDGDLVEISPDILAKLRGEIARIDGAPSVPRGMVGPAGLAIMKNHTLRQEGQRSLRHAIALWAGYHRHQGAQDSESYRRFYHQFHTDVLTAQTLNAKDAGLLEQSIRADLWLNNVTELPA